MLPVKQQFDFQSNQNKTGFDYIPKRLTLAEKIYNITL